MFSSELQRINVITIYFPQSAAHCLDLLLFLRLIGHTFVENVLFIFAIRMTRGIATAGAVIVAIAHCRVVHRMYSTARNIII